MPPHVYAALRIVCGTVALIVALNSIGHIDFLFSQQGYYKRHLVEAIEGQPRLSLLYLSDSPSWLWSCYLLRLIATALFTLGYRTRVTGLLTWILFLSFYNRNVLNVHGVEQLLSLSLLLLPWTPCGAVWSIRPQDPVPLASPLALYLIRYHLCWIYFVSGLNKALGLYWARGEAVSYVLMCPAARHFQLDALWQTPAVLEFVRLFTWVTLAWELLFPLLVLIPVTRTLALAIGLAVHGGQAIFIETGLFPPLLFAHYLAFVPPAWVARWGGWVDPSETRVAPPQPADTPQ